MTRAFGPGHVRKKATNFRGAQKAPLKPKWKRIDSVTDRNGKSKTMADLLKVHLQRGGLIAKIGTQNEGRW